MDNGTFGIKNNSGIDETGKTAAGFHGSDNSFGFGNMIADKLHNVAEAIYEKAEHQDAQSGMAQYGKQASELLEKSARYVRTFDYARADADFREYVGRKPGRSLLMAGGIGLIIGVVLRRR